MIVQIACTDAYIGSPATITITVTGSEKLTSLAYSCEYGKVSAKWLVPTSTRTITNWIVPASLYNEIPNDMSCECKMTVYYTYEGNPYEHSTYSYFTAKVNPNMSKPTILLPSVKDTNDASIALTGDNSKIVRYLSTAQLYVEASANNGALLGSTIVKNGSSSVALYYNRFAAFTAVPLTSFNITANDSRGLYTSINYTIPAERVIEYIKPTCVVGNEIPDASGNMRLTCSGSYFNGSFGAVDNTLTVEYRYKEKGGEFGAWATMTANPNGNAYTAYADLTGLDYQTTYVFECRATDVAMTSTNTGADARAKPVFHWGGNDFVHETPVDFHAGIMFNGVEGDYIEEQGTSGIWTYRKWHSGLAECWGAYSKSVYGSDWSAWGSLYQAEIVSAIAYPLTFTAYPKEVATMHSLSGGLLDASFVGLSTTTTGTYFAVHPNKLTSTYNFLLNLYVCGRWK